MGSFQRICDEKRSIFDELICFLKSSGGEFDSIDVLNEKYNFIYTKFVISVIIKGVDGIRIIKIPRGEECVQKIKINTNQYCLPLVLPHPRASIGVWSPSQSLRHFTPGSWKVYRLDEYVHIFNYSSGDAIMLVVDVLI